MKISVIIPAYNCEKYIAQTLDCIRTQTFPSRELEVLVALDAPTDNTAQVVKDYASKWQDFNLRIIELEKTVDYLWREIQHLQSRVAIIFISWTQTIL